MAIYTELSHLEWWFSVVILVYQRVRVWIRLAVEKTLKELILDETIYSKRFWSMIFPSVFSIYTHDIPHKLMDSMEKSACRPPFFGPSAGETLFGGAAEGEAKTNPWRKLAFKHIHFAFWLIIYQLWGVYNKPNWSLYISYFWSIDIAPINITIIYYLWYSNATNHPFSMVYTTHKNCD